MNLETKLLANPKIGEKVRFIPGIGESKNGIIKNLSKDLKFVFVVYKCEGKWKRYRDYTGVRTYLGSLRKGWR